MFSLKQNRTESFWIPLNVGGWTCCTGGGRSSNLIGPQVRRQRSRAQRNAGQSAVPRSLTAFAQLQATLWHQTWLTLNLHLVTTTNFKVWSFPKISSLHKMSSYGRKTQQNSRLAFKTNDQSVNFHLCKYTEIKPLWAPLWWFFFFFFFAALLFRRPVWP